MLIKTALDNTFLLVGEGSKKLISKNLAPGTQVYGEKLIAIENTQYRFWDPYRSKLAAMILKGSSVSMKKDHSILYLGAASGTTASHVSDIATEGVVFAVEFAPRAMHDLVRVCAQRMNLVPILADAAHPGSYRNMVSQVDIIYQDVAQRQQAAIAISNAEIFLAKGGILVLIIKSKCIDSAKKTREITDIEVKKLEDNFRVLELINLEPFHKDNIAVLAQMI